MEISAAGAAKIIIMVKLSGSREQHDNHYNDFLVRKRKRSQKHYGFFERTPVSKIFSARLAQSVERRPFKPVVVGSSPTVGVFKNIFCLFPTLTLNIFL